MSKNTLADKVTTVALKQLQTSWTFKQPRIQTIRKYRKLYNVEVQPKLRVQFNVPIPVFSGMIDTLQADLEDGLLLQYESQDPADWKPIQKMNAAIKQESDSVRPGAKWDEKWRAARLEAIFSGRGILKFTAGNDKDGYYSNLETVAFEDFFFEPMGGGDLQNHIFCGQQNIWRTKQQLLDSVKEGIYDGEQVKSILDMGKTFRMAGVWDGFNDVGNRFTPLGLSNDSNNYVGEEVFHLIEWVTSYQGKRWYLVIEAYTGTWLRFEKLEDVCSSGYYPWVSFASHKDLKNFASKSFADDLYPVADSIITLFNQDLTNRQKRNLNARAYDKEMFKDVAKLDEAQYRPDALVPVDTKSGSRKISEGLYSFQTPELTGTVDLITWLSTKTGEQMAVTDMQQGGVYGGNKKAPSYVVMAQIQQIEKRIGFMSQPFIQAGQELAQLFFTSLKDYMYEPMSVKLLGETGFEWTTLKRLDLNFKRDFEITVVSKSQSSTRINTEKKDKQAALQLVAQSPNINTKARDEYLLRDVGGFSEYETAILMDNTNQANKESASLLAAAIQEIGLRGKKPDLNYNADLFFLHGLLKFARKMRGDLSDSKFKMLLGYIDETQKIVADNVRTGVLPAPPQPPVPPGQNGQGGPAAPGQGQNKAAAAPPVLNSPAVLQ